VAFAVHSSRPRHDRRYTDGFGKLPVRKEQAAIFRLPCCSDEPSTIESQRPSIHLLLTDDRVRLDITLQKHK